VARRSTQHETDPALEAVTQPVNQVHLLGRWQGTVQRELPSGDVVVTGRVVVRRPEGGVDALDCSVWAAALRRKVMRWPEGAQVELSGSLRRRFFRTGAGSASRYEVHVAQIRRIGPRRDASG
jgi:single-strand DNA-binding protein